MKRVALGLLVFAMVLGTYSAAFAQKATVLRVVVVQSDNVAAYLQELERGKELLKKVESPSIIRVWQARFAGDEAGTVVVSIEYPSLSALAADDEKMRTNAEIAAWLKGLDKVRKVVSDSIYREL